MPVWRKIEALPAFRKKNQCVQFLESILDAIEAAKREPDIWEALYLSYAVHTLVDGRYYGALTFAEMSLIEVSSRCDRPVCVEAAIRSIWLVV